LAERIETVFAAGLAEAKTARGALEDGFLGTFRRHVGRFSHIAMAEMSR
jgi:hypothetical protein